MGETLKILVYGYGNPGRQDDGMGVFLAESMEKWARENNLSNVETDSNYQLNIEDASRIAAFDAVIFADASREDIPGYALTRVLPSARVEFTMHAVSPAFILNLCQEVYHKAPLAYLLHIRGSEWEFLREMTPDALKNLQEATVFLQRMIRDMLADVRPENENVSFKIKT